MEREALYYRKVEKGSVACILCPHKCFIPQGGKGRCGVRENRNGQLISLNYGKIVAANDDPIEKKPLFHFLPGSRSFSIAAAGCNFHCTFCQNWHISQVCGNDSGRILRNHFRLTTQDIIKEALALKCKSIAYTYTEPTVFYEIMKETSQSAKDAKLKNVVVSNGFIAREPLEAILPYIDAFNIDLKAFTDEFYKKNCSGTLNPVIESIEKIKKSGKWLEITTLVIPGKNNSRIELRNIAEFIASLDKCIPWHVSRFFPNYRMSSIQSTDENDLEKALEEADKAGLKFVYTGNSGRENETECIHCGKTVISRKGYKVEIKANEKGECDYCGSKIEGVW